MISKILIPILVTTAVLYSQDEDKQNNVENKVIKGTIRQIDLLSGELVISSPQGTDTVYIDSSTLVTRQMGIRVLDYNAPVVIWYKSSENLKTASLLVGLDTTQFQTDSTGKNK